LKLLLHFNVVNFLFLLKLLLPHLKTHKLSDQGLVHLFLLSLADRVLHRNHVPVLDSLGIQLQRIVDSLFFCSLEHLVNQLDKDPSI
jgi:hypothetical protein